MISVFNTLHFKCIRDVHVEMADMSLNLTGRIVPGVFQSPLDESHQHSNVLTFHLTFNFLKIYVFYCFFFFHLDSPDTKPCNSFASSCYRNGAMKLD